MKCTLEVTTTVGCRNACHFCPQKTLVSAYNDAVRMMTLEVFCTCLDKTPTTCRIDMSGYAEPFFNPMAAQMMLYARERGHELHLYTTLMGLPVSSLSALVLSRPDYIRIHVPDKTGLILPDDKWIERHEVFLSTSLKATYMTMGELTPAVKKHLDGQGIKVEVPPMLSRGGSLWNPGDKKGNIQCSMDRFHSNVLLPNGDVYGCCMDYGLSMRLGNLLHQPYSDIYDAAEDWRLSDHNGSICAKCEWAVVKR